MPQDPATEVLAILRRRPAVHRLTYGAYVQGHFWIDINTFVVPLAPMGFSHAAGYAVQYHQEILGMVPERRAIAELDKQGAFALPVVAVVRFTDEAVSSEVMEALALPHLNQAEQLLAWITGDNVTAFASLVATQGQLYFKATPPHSRQRMLLGPGNIGHNLERNVAKIRDAANGDEHFAFALSLYSDALHERNKLFKIARLFNVLEALAYALKTQEIKSRAAVRLMLGLETGAADETSYGRRKVRYQRIELSGRVRDKLYHGVSFVREHLSAEWRDSFDVFSDQPDLLVSSLMSDCELEFAKWGNNVSVARTAAEQRSKTR
jgi:hypothetical protein